MENGLVDGERGWVEAEAGVEATLIIHWFGDGDWVENGMRLEGRPERERIRLKL